MHIVLDPSVAMKWYVPERDSENAVSFRDWAKTHTHDWVVPTLFFSECANVLWKKATLLKEISAQTSSDILDDLVRLPLIRSDETITLPEAYALAIRFKMPVYDAVYLAAANRCHGALITADTAFVRRLASSEYAGIAIPINDWKDHFVR